MTTRSNELVKGPRLILTDWRNTIEMITARFRSVIKNLAARLFYISTENTLLATLSLLIKDAYNINDIKLFSEAFNLFSI